MSVRWPDDPEETTPRDVSDARDPGSLPARGRHRGEGPESRTPQVPLVRPAGPVLGGAAIGALIVILVFCSPLLFV